MRLTDPVHDYINQRLDEAEEQMFGIERMQIAVTESEDSENWEFVWIKAYDGRLQMTVF